MPPRLLRRVRDFCANPQDLVERDEVQALLAAEFGLPGEDASRLVDWLLDRGWLLRRTHTHVDGDRVVERETLRSAPRFAVRPREAGDPAVNPDGTMAGP